MSKELTAKKRAALNRLKTVRGPEAGARSGGPGRTGAGRTHRAGWCQLITDTVSPAKLVT